MKGTVCCYHPKLFVGLNVWPSLILHDLCLQGEIWLVIIITDTRLSKLGKYNHFSALDGCQIFLTFIKVFIGFFKLKLVFDGTSSLIKWSSRYFPFFFFIAESKEWVVISSCYINIKVDRVQENEKKLISVYKNQRSISIFVLSNHSLQLINLHFIVLLTNW